MGVVEELIRKDADGTLSFGNYLLDTKTKKSDFAFEGATYKIKTFKEITKLEKNGTLVYESVPGSTVTKFKGNPDVVEFEVVDGESAGRIPTNVGGKLNASLSLNEGAKSSVKIVKC